MIVLGIFATDEDLHEVVKYVPDTHQQRSNSVSRSIDQQNREQDQADLVKLKGGKPMDPIF